MNNSTTIRIFGFLFFTQLTALNLFATDYYWIGGTGNWSQITHWATTSGGTTVHSSTPGSSDNVYFDANSFASSGQTVTLDIAASCADMDWTGATNTPTLAGSQALNIYGGLTAINAMNWNATSGVFFKASSGTHNLDLNGISSLGTIYFDGTGTFGLSDSLHSANNVYFYQGTFNSNNYKIYTRVLGTHYSNSATVNLGTSDVYITNSYGLSNQNNNTIINASSAHLFFTYSSSSRTSFHCYSNSSFGTITSNSSLELRLHNANATIDSLIITYSGGSSSSSFYVGGTINYLYQESSDLYIRSSYSPLIKKAELNGFLYTQYNCTFDTLLLSSSTGAQTYTFGSGYTCTITDSIAFPTGVCATPHTIKSSSSSNATISKSSGNLTAEFIILNSITATGGATFTANNVISEDGNNTGWTINTLAAQDFYWVGGTGNWSDPTNWATSSGGTPQTSSGCVPSATSNVYFDANSFSAASQTVTLDIAASCADMDWTGATNTPTLAGSQALNIYGGLTAINAMNWNATSGVFFKASSGTHNLDLNGISSLGTIYFDGTGTFGLSDSLHSANNVYFYQGTFNSNNYKIYTRVLGTHYSNSATVNLGTSDVYITNSYGLSNQNNNTIINASSAHLFFTYSSSSRTSFHCYSNSSFGTITSNSSLELRLHNANATIDSLIITYSGGSSSSSFYVGGTINYLYQESSDLYIRSSYSPLIKKAELNGFLYTQYNCTFDTLLLSSSTGAQTYTFGSGYTCTITDSIAFPTGVCATPHTIKSSSSSNATISKSSGNLTAEFIILNSITATGGATFTANNVISEDGNNTGWTINTLAAQDFYWVGGTGNWSDPTNWATSSGGTPQTSSGCVPSATSNVYFDANSFSAASQTVTLDIAASCTDMDWTGATNTPTFSGSQSLNIYGGLTAINAMNWSASGSMYFKASSGTHSIDLDGITTFSYVYIDGAATFNLIDSFHSSQNLYINQGNFNSNNHTIYARGLFSSGSASGTINLGTSKVYTISSYGIDNQNSNLVYNASAAEIYLIYTTSGRITFKCYSNSSFGTITSNSSLELRLHNANATIDSLIITYSGGSSSSSFYVGGTINYLYQESSDLYIRSSYSPLIKKAELNGFLYTQYNCTFDTLLLLKEGSATTHTFGAGYTCTINDSVLLNSNGCFKANVKSSSTSQIATISMPTGKSFNTDFIDLAYITATGGGTFNAGANSNDGGNNTGWTFTGDTYTLSLTYNDVCISPNGYSEAKVIPDGNTTNFWWRQTVSPFDTFNTGIDTVMVNSAVNYVFVAEFGTNCQKEDSVFITIQVPANGSEQSYQNTAGSQDWDDCSNWNLGFIPDTLSDVSVGVGNTLLVQADTAWCKDFIINGTLQLTGGVLIVYGDFENNGEVVQTGGKIVFMGSTAASITGTGRIVADSVELNKEAELTLSNVLIVSDYFKFTKGIVQTNASDSLYFDSTSSTNEGNSLSFVDGPSYKYGSTSFVFPTGDNNVWSRIAISDPSVASSNLFKAQYYNNLHSDTANYTSPIVKVSGKEYWQLDKVVGSGSIKVTIHTEDSAASGIDDASAITVAKYTGSYWTDVEISSYSMVSGVGSFTSDYVTTFSPFTFGTTGFMNPVPVELIRFEANPISNQSVNLDWATASELNNSHFNIERSYDNVNFETIDYVSGNGNSQEVVNYRYLDNTIDDNQTIVYYRLNQFDYDGSNELSNVKSVNFDEFIQANQISIYPNPVQEQLTLLYSNASSKNLNIKIYTMNGSELENWSITKAVDSQILDISKFRKGIYFLSVFDNNTIQNFKVVKE